MWEQWDASEMVQEFMVNLAGLSSYSEENPLRGKKLKVASFSLIWFPPNHVPPAPSVYH